MQDPRIGRKIGSYTFEKSIGKGQYGTVYLARGDDEKKYAVKCIKKKIIGSDQMLKKLLRTEVHVMNFINHPNIMHLFEFLESANNYYLIIQFCNNGDLEGYVEKQEGNLLQEAKAVYFLKQIMNGFQCLHTNKIMHRDFKLANIFLHEDTVIIGDFGFAKSGFDMAQTKLGTPLTMAPEQLENRSAYTSKADLWSIGVVYYQMLFGDYPFYALDMNSLLAKIKLGSGSNLKFPTQKNQISQNSKDLLRNLLQDDPDRRIDWESFFNHPLFEGDAPPAQGGQSNPSHRGLLSAMGQLLKNSTVVDKNFEEARNNVPTNELNTDDMQDPLNMEEASPAPINETESMESGPQLSMNEIFKENSFRYYHEKNKIMVIFLTVKKLRKLQKMPQFESFTRTIYLLTLILAKKGAMLSELTLYSLNFKNNIFKLQAFDIYCDTSEECKNAKQLLRGDQPSIFSYHRHLWSKKGEVPLKQKDEALLSWLKQDFIDLQDLDNHARQLYQEIHTVGNASENPEFAKELYITKIFTIYSIRSEVYIPYKLEGQKFLWDNFKEKYEDFDLKYLLKILESLGV